MCRLLFARGREKFPIGDFLPSFAEICRTSKEYQGHGWGLAWRENDNWHYYHTVQPIWEDDLAKFPETNHLLVHARSAFQDEGIVVENNMPFARDDAVFIFNGELRGVKIREQGRIGAEKIFNYIMRFVSAGLLPAVVKGVQIIAKRTRYVRAMNIIISDGKRVVVSTQFAEDPDYFTLYRKRGNLDLVCSVPFAGESGWESIENGSTFEL